MFITCHGCKTPFSCTDTEECGNEVKEFSVELQASIIWSRVYPDRKPWVELGQEAKDEWVRFTIVARSVILCEEK